MTQQPDHHRRSERSCPFVNGQRILVAGGSGNVGRYIVAALLEGSAQVVVPTRSTEKLDAIRKIHGGADGLLPILGDIADEKDGPRILEEILAGGRTLDGAVASLGAFVPTRSILAASKADLARAVEGYLMAHHGTARNVIPRLHEGGGTYTMIQGPLAFDVWSPESSLVSVATAAQAMLARAIMGEGADSGSPPRTSTAARCTSSLPTRCTSSPGLAPDRWLSRREARLAARPEARAVALPPTLRLPPGPLTPDATHGPADERT